MYCPSTRTQTQTHKTAVRAQKTQVTDTETVKPTSNQTSAQTSKVMSQPTANQPSSANQPTKRHSHNLLLKAISFLC